MSTLTVCPYCGEGMHFDEMKRHFLSCEGCARSSKSQPRYQSAELPLSPPDKRPVSGLEFYNRLNKLSVLTRSRSRSGSRRGALHEFMASPNQRDAATVPELMYPNTSLAMDIAPLRSSTSVSSCEGLGGQVEWRSPSRASAVAMESVSPLVSPSSRAVRVSLRQPDSNSTVDSRTEEEAVERNECEQRSSNSFSYHAASALANQSAAAATQKERLHEGRKAASVPMRSRSRSSKEGKAQAMAAEMVEQVAMPNMFQGFKGSAADSRASPTSSNAASVGERRPRVPVDRTKAIGDAVRCELPSARPVLSSRSSEQRPMPQLSSFAIRLRGSGGCSARRVEEFTPEGGTRAPHGGPENAAESAYGLASSAHKLSVTQLNASLRHMQLLVERQQEQYNSLLQAHADLNRQVAAQQGAYNEMMRRSLEQASVVKAALQQHTTQWHSEHVALSESIAALWASVSEMQHRLSQHQIGSPRAPAPAPVPPLLSPPKVYPALGAPPSASSPRRPFHASNSTTTLTEVAEHVPASTVAMGNAVPIPQQPAEHDTRTPAPAPAISVERAAPVEASAYYSDIASFIQHDVPAFSVSASAVMSQSGVSVSGCSHASAVTDVKGASRGLFAHIPTAASTRTAAAGFVPPSVAQPVTSPTVSSSRGSSMPHVGHRSTTLPRTTPLATDVSRQQQQNSQTSIEDRVMAMLRAEPTVVVHRSPWR
ncbi:hypothetical protein ABL78_0285 [Leptomonas seymouri]|uniref:Uncharacterized protein n=1 Tax=Leptomonas seymouri TaxID=5684 RepID=A0A0N1PGI6_LEPSE|nr:hypothetical protein ABL78_0285 [Leptomonas seymouri]|eukprot:KPI90525.1 hypothetical protein ABL78_0285 [Leptomonas seymouri]